MTCSRYKRAIDPALEADGLRLGAGRAPPLLGLCKGASGKELTDVGFSEEVEHRFRRKLNTDFGKLNIHFGHRERSSVA